MSQTYAASYTPNWGLVSERAVNQVAVKVAAQFKKHYREINTVVEFGTDGPMVQVGRDYYPVSDEQMTEVVSGMPVYLGKTEDGIEIAVLDAWLQ
jgi:hypothetical protein